MHTRNVPLADDVDLATIASNTPGMVGADLRNLVNEAALTAARRNRDAVTLADFNDALERIVLGAARKIMLSDEERERTAYHESGHAVLGMLEPGADPVRKVSIVPRGRALGVTFQSPESDRYGYDARLPARPHRRRARRPRGRGDHLRQRHDRRRVGPRAGHEHRPADGRPLGHVRGGRARVGAAAPRGRGRRCSPAPARRPRRRAS